MSQLWKTGRTSPFVALMRRDWEPFLRAMTRYFCGENSLNSPVFSDLTCTNWGIWMYLSGFTGFNVEMLPRLHKVLLHDSLLWAPEAILRDLTRLFASLGWAWIFWTSCLVATESLHMPSSFQYSPSFFFGITNLLAANPSWPDIIFPATEERNTLSLMAPQAEQMQIVVASSCYCFASVGMLLFNKFAVQDFPLDSWETGDLWSVWSSDLRRLG